MKNFKIVEELQKLLPEGTKIVVIQKEVNNGQVKSGLSITEKDNRMGRSLYYEDLLEGWENPAKAAEILYQAYRHAIPLPDQGDFDKSVEYADVKKKLYVRLVNGYLNRKRLEGQPHEDFLDLAVIPYVHVSRDGANSWAYQVKTEHLERWGKTGEEIMKEARENTKRITPSDIMDLEQVHGIRKSGSGKEDEHMLILTNKPRLNGASAMLDEDILKEVSRRLGGPFWIAPSSIHEVMCYRYAVQDAKRLMEVIEAANKTQVQEDEMLASHPYFYRDGRISIHFST